MVDVEICDRIAVLTLKNERALNALTPVHCRDLTHKLNAVGRREDIIVTIVTGAGRFFSAGADVKSASGLPACGPSDSDPAASRAVLVREFLITNMDLTRAFYTHSKVLVVGLNGPAVGLMAALVALADFVYVAADAYVLVPFASLGLAAEGASSRALAHRIGPARANELLLMGRRMAAKEMVATGFANELLDPPAGLDFRLALVNMVRDRLVGPHLIGNSQLTIKRLLRQTDLDVLERQNVSEVFAGLDRFITGEPQAEFRKLRGKETRHKL